jgi:peptidoglycan/LPS O-acetylase OafA/YrhL
MQARHLGRPNPTSQARLQLILAVLAAWNILSFALELMNAGPVSVDGVDGILGARALSGATGVLGIAYLYAARNPVRYRFVLWLATLEQFVALFTATFHWARGDFGGSEAIVPIIVAAIFLVLLMTNQPRQTDTI